MISKEVIKIWAKKLQGGDSKTFREIFNYYYPRLLKYCMNILHSQEDAEEVVQDVFVKLWLKRKQINTSQSLESFLFTITRNRTYDYLRKVSADKNLREGLWTLFQHEAANTESSIIWKDYQSLTEKAIAILPPQRQKIYRMSREEGLSHEEIAARLNLSPKTVNNHLTLALQSIRQYLKPHLDIALLVLLLFL